MLRPGYWCLVEPHKCHLRGKRFEVVIIVLCVLMKTDKRDKHDYDFLMIRSFSNLNNVL